MSFFDDYIADGLCCQVCGAYIDDDEPGFPRTCEDCLQEEQRRKQKKKQKLQGARKIEQVRKVLEENNISYELKNISTGHFHTRRKNNNQLIEFYAYTGKITIVGKVQKARGIEALIQILLGEGNTNENTSKSDNNKSS